ncbi:hypothetical protein SLH46_21310 [Draconibacterium sp. IB214405]|uniref:hypothetical protein n=1 Tax=Draconibacterium sp. IB214405 TaxID=3097352 RepID=UPI002A0BF8A3|nr:hypothetical protein [Draconibacterium sp. IB214405]MDX8341752.1 hypothetical protein [Draconibacterium sp. IB214405]
MACSVFISYRRKTNEETNYKGFVAHINDLLKYRYNIHEDDLFFDKRSMGVGDEFKQEIEKNAIACKALILIINRDWEAQFREKKEKHEDDFVLTEILCTLKSSHKVIFFPVLVNRTEVPKSEDLPEELKTHIDIFKEFNVCDFSGDFTKVDQFVSEELGKKIVEKFPELSNTAANLEMINTSALKPSDILGQRGDQRSGFIDSFYYERDDIDGEIVEIFRNSYQTPKVLLYGKSLAGKSRAIYHYLKSEKSPFNKIILITEDNINATLQKIESLKSYRQANDIIIVFEELYKCYLSNIKIEKLLEYYSDFPIIASCTEFEYNLIKAELIQTKFGKIVVGATFDKIKIKILTKEQVSEIIKFTGYSHRKGLTIGALLGISYPWESYKKDEQLPFVNDVLDAIRNITYLAKDKQCQSISVVNYLNQKLQNNAVSQNNYISYYNLKRDSQLKISIEDVMKPIMVLANFGILYKISPNEFDKDDIHVDEDYYKNIVKTLSFQDVEKEILKYAKNNKNIARLIVHPKAINIKHLFRNRIDDRLINRVYNAYIQKTVQVFKEANKKKKLTAFEVAKLLARKYLGEESRYDVVTIQTLSKYATTKYEVTQILNLSQSIEDTKYETNASVHKPKKVNILNSLLNNFTEVELLEVCPKLKEIFQYNEATYHLILKTFGRKDYALCYFKENKLHKFKLCVRHLIRDRRFHWSLEEYENIIDSYIPKFSVTEEHFEFGLELFNEALKRCKRHNAKLYKWGLEHKYIKPDMVSLISHLQYTKDPQSAINNIPKRLINIRVLNKLTQISRDYCEAKEWYERILTPDDFSFDYLMKKTQNSEQIEFVFNEMKNSTLNLEYSVVSLIVQKLKILGARPIDVFSELFNEKYRHFVLNKYSLNKLLIGCSSQEDGEEMACEIFQKAHLTKTKISLDSFNVLLGIISYENFDDLMVELQNKYNPDSFTYRSILRNEKLKSAHEKYFDLYVKYIAKTEISHDDLCIKNFLEPYDGYANKIKKIEEFEDLNYTPTPEFLSQLSHEITSDEDLIALSEYWGKFYSSPLPKLIVEKIITFYKWKKSSDFSPKSSILKLAQQHQLDTYGLNKALNVFKQTGESQMVAETLKELESFGIIPDVATYSIWLECCDNFEEARVVFRQAPRPNHVLYNNLLKKVTSYQEFIDVFTELEEKILIPERGDIDRENLDRTFNIWLCFIRDKLDLDEEKQNLQELLLNKENEYSYRLDCSRNAILNRDRDLEEAIASIKESTTKNIRNYNSLFVKCKAFSDVKMIVDAIREDRVVAPDKETYYQFVEKFTLYKNGESRCFEYTTHQFSLLTATEIKFFKNDTRFWSQLLYLWLQQANNIQEVRQVFAFDSKWRIPKHKDFLPWELDWFKNTINSISCAEDASLLYSRIKNSWKVDFVKQLNEPNKINEYISNEPDKETLARSWQWSCQDINEFRLIRSVFPDLVSSNCQGNPWYKRVIQSIQNLNDANYFYEALDDDWKMDNQVVDILKQLGSLEDKKRFIKNKPDRNNLKESILHFSCNNLNDFKDIQKIIPDIVVNKNTLWYKRVVSSINNLDDANYFYDYLDDAWRKDLQVVHLMKQLDSIEEKKKFVLNKPDRDNLSLSCLYLCSDINEFRALIEIFPGSYFPNYNAPWYRSILNSIAKIEDAKYFTQGLNAIDNKQVIEDVKAQLNIDDQEKLTEFCAKTKKDRSKHLEVVRTFSEFKSLTVKYPNWKVPSYHRAEWYKYTIQTINNLNDAKYFFNHIDNKGNYNHVTNIVYRLNSRNERENFFQFIFKEYPGIKYDEGRMRKILGDS